MNVFLINCFDTYQERVDLVYKFFSEKGDHIRVVQSNFKHMKKERIEEERENYIWVETKQYKRNFSYNRCKSHYLFAKAAFEIINKFEADLIYVIFPPNSIGKFLKKYKSKNSNCKVVIDIMDLWPETLPFKINKDIFILKKWRKMRDDSLKIADFIILECNLYRKFLKEELKDTNTRTIYLARNERDIEITKKLSEETIELVYLGSINNIIDINLIKKILSGINSVKKIKLHIIGDGERRNDLIKALEENNLSYEFYGKIYDLNKKISIFNKCHFGLNIMKEHVCVGLTMKSIDYFEGGLPILNNIKHDTWTSVNKNKIGFNINSNQLDEIIKKIVSMKNSEFLEMSKVTRKMYMEKYSYEIFEKEMNSGLSKILQLKNEVK